MKGRKECVTYPPYVLPCSPGWMVSIMSLSAKTAETGYTPPERALPRRTTSGLTLSHSQASILPVRPRP